MADEKTLTKDGLETPSKAAPLSSIFIVMTEAVDGEEDEFNDWYTNIHCHDTMRLKGSVATQRWKLSPYQLRYNARLIGPEQRWLCIYELNDTQQNIDDHVEQCFSDRMPITSAQRIDKAEDFYYVPVAGAKPAVETYNSRDGDVLRLAPGPTSFAIKGPFGAVLSTEGDNLVTRAATVFARAFDVANEGAFILDKRLPVASGIGGGSADAAAALRALARRHGIGIDDPRLFACADALGSDVPACLLGQSALGRGRGEQLEPLTERLDEPYLGGQPVTMVVRQVPLVQVGKADAEMLRALGDESGLVGPCLAVAAMQGTTLKKDIGLSERRGRKQEKTDQQ